LWLTFTAFFYIRKDKSKFPVASVITPINLNKKIIGAVEVFRDISKENNSDKAKTEFASLVSHQLRTPLRLLIGILNYCSLEMPAH